MKQIFMTIGNGKVLKLFKPDHLIYQMPSLRAASSKGSFVAPPSTKVKSLSSKSTYHPRVVKPETLAMR
jgi:hypothetical protein